ncbi:hypothetical protein MKSMC1_53310 [Mycobacterium kansasii]|nr:hypothetical protein MKSMC1_53310 [Mycobacterium kansasii]
MLTRPGGLKTAACAAATNASPAATGFCTNWMNGVNADAAAEAPA